MPRSPSTPRTPKAPDLATLIREATTPEQLHALFLSYPAKEDRIAEAIAKEARCGDAALYREIAKSPYRVRLYVENPHRTPLGVRAIAAWSLTRLAQEAVKDVQRGAADNLETLIGEGYLAWDTPEMEAVRALLGPARPSAYATQRQMAAATLVASHPETPVAELEALVARTDLPTEGRWRRAAAMHPHATTAVRLAWVQQADADDTVSAAEMRALRDDPAVRAVLLARARTMNLVWALVPLCAQGWGDCGDLLREIQRRGTHPSILAALAPHLATMAPHLTAEDLLPFCEHPEAEVRLLAAQATGLVPSAANNAPPPAPGAGRRGVRV